MYLKISAEHAIGVGRFRAVLAPQAQVASRNQAISILENEAWRHISKHVKWRPRAIDFGVLSRGLIFPSVVLRWRIADSTSKRNRNSSEMKNWC
jgi:hypothetical protein